MQEDKADRCNRKIIEKLNYFITLVPHTPGIPGV